jgi:hypothetical protein
VAAGIGSAGVPDDIGREVRKALGHRHVAHLKISVLPLAGLRNAVESNEFRDNALWPIGLAGLGHNREGLAQIFSGTTRPEVIADDIEVRTDPGDERLRDLRRQTR